ncbi:MAG: methionine--tRNA ligase [Bacteroidota bacterium]
MTNNLKHKKFLVTSALPYANGPLHIGHLAGAYISADIYVRYLRLKGADVVYVCGSDENGAAITIRAKKEGLTPRDIVDKYHFLIKETFEKLGVSFDVYHRTSDPLHHKTAQDFFLTLVEKGGEFDVKSSEQYYDEAFDQFLADRYIKGTCPKCSYEEAYGDQCENCGSDLSPTELINPISTLSGNTPVLRETTHWYFRLDKHTEWLKDWVKDGQLRGKQHHNPAKWKKHVVGQILSWLDGDLRPRSITRDLDWGIPVPLEEGKGKVLYVWFDAPIGYISATKAWAEENGKNWEDYWKGDDTNLVHFIGKDNIVFHCIIFPAMLKAHGDFAEPKFALPVNVPANQFLNLQGNKLSTSRNFAVWAHEYLEDFKDLPNKEDALRYALIRNMPELKDSDFTWEGFQELHDSELVAKLGNFVNRVVNLTHKYYDGESPQFDGGNLKARSATEIVAYEAIIDLLKEKINTVGSFIENFDFRSAVREVIDIASVGNEILQHNEPWKVFKTDPEAVKPVIGASLQVAGVLSIVLQPFLPFTAAALRNILNLEPLENEQWDDLEDPASLVPGGHKINPPEYLFKTINDRKDKSRLELVEKEIAKLSSILEEKAKEEVKGTPVKPEATFEDFTKLDIRTGTILSAEKVEKADKLLKLLVDIGIEKRTVVSGIAKHHAPEAIIGQKVLLLANLAPRKIRGVFSEGMILMAEDADGKLAFVSPPEDFGDGFQVS